MLVVAGLITAKDKDDYTRTHKSELILHEAASRALQTAKASGGKLPRLAAMKSEYAKLTECKDALETQYA